ncbi:DegT/DnrJ/EryC1/StrS family aminotransferase [Planktomarina temperata]|nr:DegT/DnrJ/EryC1/StrS family aminotransferase [bacterium]MDA9971776.1 DegT/DnrJ/EryC1/StrS family aminotransferase [Planktomarina temperata]
MKEKLALFGGDKIRTELFPINLTTDSVEAAAVNEIMQTGILSNYLGAAHENFMGGKAVRRLEAAWSEHFQVTHALAVNSNTSGLIAALGACGIAPGDEVIVSPYSMSISAVAPIFWGATPIFADVEVDQYCLDIKSIKKCVTEKTKAIIAVDLFGNPFDAQKIMDFAKSKNIFVIEDCAQAPGAKLNGKFAGTLGDIGVFSLNYHKHIQSGEGGIVVTNNKALADKISLIRNHGEAVVSTWDNLDFNNAIGYNFRMGEIEAAIALKQLDKIDHLLERRLENVSLFEHKIKQFSEFRPSQVRPGALHVHYQHTLVWHDENSITRNEFVSAVKAELPCFEGREKEGVKIGAGYVKPIYMLPLFAKDRSHSIISVALQNSWQKYEKGLCPIVEILHYDKLINHEFIVPSMKEKDIDCVIDAFDKVLSNSNKIISKRN